MTHSGFNPKKVAHILDIVFITRSLIIFVRNSSKIYYGISGRHISYWPMVGWSVVGAFAWWSIGRWPEVGDRLFD